MPTIVPYMESLRRSEGGMEYETTIRDKNKPLVDAMTNKELWVIGLMIKEEVSKRRR